MKYANELTEQLADALETLEAYVMGSSLYAGLPASAPTPPAMIKSHDALAKYRKVRKHYFTPEDGDSGFCAVCSKYVTDDAHHRTVQTRIPLPTNR